MVEAVAGDCSREWVAICGRQQWWFKEEARNMQLGGDGPSYKFYFRGIRQT